MSEDTIRTWVIAILLVAVSAALRGLRGDSGSTGGIFGGGDGDGDGDGGD